MRSMGAMMLAALISLAVAAGGWADTPERGEADVAAGPDFARFVAEFRATAVAKGVPGEVYDRALAGLEPDSEVIVLLNEQPEFKRTIWDYLDRAVSEERMSGGRRELAARKTLFDALEARYGVDRHVLTAIWGLESKLGADAGQRSVIRSLATLAHSGRRQRYGRVQLIAALKILAAGDIDRGRMLGSWAGAMGHTQFTPIAYLDRAVDFDGDGRRDIWGSVEDALASAANFLKRAGWRPGEPVLHEVRLPADFNYELADISSSRPVGEWRAFGIRRADGRGLGDAHRRASVLLPAGARGPAFLIYRNFYIVMRYNPATAYALAIGHLADRLRGAGPFVGTWPRGERALSQDERKELQIRLTAAGFDPGGVDGLLGPKTRAAVRAFQKSAGLLPDAYPSVALLTRLRAAH